MRWLRTLCVCGALTGACVGGAQAQSGGAAQSTAAPADPLAEDVRLTQKLTARIEGMPMNDLLALFSRQTGVTLKAQQDIADEKVVLFTSARPLRDVLHDLAALRNDTWLRQEGKPGKPSYRLARNGRARELENDLLDKINNRLAHRLQAQVQALSETPEQLQRRPADDPIRKRLMNRSGRIGTQFYALLSPKQRQDLFAARYLDVPYPALTPEQQAALRQVLADINAHTGDEKTGNQDGGNVENAGQATAGLPKDLDRSAMRFEISEQRGSVALGFGFEPKGEGLDGTDIAQVDNGAEWLLPPRGNPYTGKPIPKEAVLPSGSKTQTAGEEKAWVDRLRRLWEQTGTPLCADYYRSQAAHPVTMQEEDPNDAAPTGTPASHEDAAAELDALCKPVGYLWWTRGKTLMLRKRDWFVQRQYEVSDTWVLGTAEHLRANNGVPTGNDALRLLDLSTEQIAGLASYNPVENGAHYADLGFMRQQVLGSRELLAVWNQFPAGGQTPLPGREKDVSALVQAMEQSTKAYSDLSDTQRALTRQFVNSDYVFGAGVPRRRQAATSPEMSAFRTRLASPAPNAAVPSPTASAALSPVRVELWWWLEGSPDQHQGIVFLPRALPDDRRDRHKVELVP